MGATETLRALVVIIAGPAIAHRASTKAWPEPNVFQRLPTSPGMPGQMREPARSVDMQPVPFACDAHPGFIGVLQWARAQPVGNMRHHRGELLCCELDPPHERSLRY